MGARELVYSRGPVLLTISYTERHWGCMTSPAEELMPAANSCQVAFSVSTC